LSAATELALQVVHGLVFGFIKRAIAIGIESTKDSIGKLRSTREGR
jgi:hypothetical protein